jgi:hypothetical protein
MTIPNTGGWQSWTTISKEISLSAGAQVWRLVIDSAGADGAVGNFNYLRLATSGGGGGTTSTPFTGTPVALPGTIQAENFDNGGSGIAFFDTTAGNAGGKYRTTGIDVDIEATTDSGGGYDVGWTKATEWLNYTVNVATAGTYTLEARVASSGAGGTFHIEANGVDKTGPMTIPNTGGWQSWTTISKEISLSAGAQVWRLVIDSAGAGGAVGNFNYLRLTTSGGGGGTTSTPFTGTPVALPGTIQAEDFDNGGAGIAYSDTTAVNSGGRYRSTAVDIEVTSDTGGGYNLGYVYPGEWLNYSVDVSTAGVYNLDIRYAVGGAGGTFHVEVGGVNVTGPIAVSSTGGWQTWRTIRVSGITLAAGSQIWRVVIDTANVAGKSVANLNWLSATIQP